MTGTLTWIVGRGGLLGGHVEAALAADDPSTAIWRPAAAIPWQDADGARTELTRQGAEFLLEAARSGAPWRLLWCAGAGVIATPPEALAQETALLTSFLDDLATELKGNPTLGGAGSLLFASSAGGVYSASEGRPPFDETSPVRPLAPYGREKLLQEALFRKLADTCAIDLLIGRFSNLYGPGQKLSKPQGLVAHVGRSALRREPISIYVPLDTIRDYLFAPDAGRMVSAAILQREQARRAGASARTDVKIFASEVETTVASVLGAWRQALRHPLRVAYASSAVGELQPRVLSFRSHVWPDVRGRPTLLPLGIDAVRRDQLARLLAAGLD